MIALVTWIWQGLVIAFATAALLALARRLNAASRHAVWWLALSAVLALPFVYAVSAFRSVTATAPAALPLPAGPDWLLRLALPAWSALATLGAFRIAKGVRTVVRLKRTGVSIDPALESRLAGWQGADAHGPRPQLRVSEEGTGACALGLGRPVILLSRALVDALDEDALDAVVMHERAHLERHDDWGQLLQAIVRAAVGWHPAVWYIDRRINLEREAACDDRVVSRTGNVRSYARALVDAASARTSWRTRLARIAMPGAADSKSLLRRRVRRLLDPGLDRGTRVGTATSLASTGVLVAVLAVAANLPALFVIVEAVVAVPHVAAPTRWTTRVPAAASVAVPSVAGEWQRAAAKTAPATPAAPASNVTAAPIASIPEIVAEPLALARSVLVRASQPPPAPGRADVRGWSAPAARSATSGGQGLARSGVIAGHRARDSGLAIARFFTNASKRIAGSF